MINCGIPNIDAIMSISRDNTLDMDTENKQVSSIHTSINELYDEKKRESALKGWFFLCVILHRIVRTSVRRKITSIVFV